jgi:hypothetical protein
MECACQKLETENLERTEDMRVVTVVVQDVGNSELGLCHPFRRSGAEVASNPGPRRQSPRQQRGTACGAHGVCRVKIPSSFRVVSSGRTILGRVRQSPETVLG